MWVDSVNGFNGLFNLEYFLKRKHSKLKLAQLHPTNFVQPMQIYSAFCILGHCQRHYLFLQRVDSRVSGMEQMGNWNKNKVSLLAFLSPPIFFLFSAAKSQVHYSAYDQTNTETDANTSWIQVNMKLLNGYKTKQFKILLTDIISFTSSSTSGTNSCLNHISSVLDIGKDGVMCAVFILLISTIIWIYWMPFFEPQKLTVVWWHE